MIAILKRWFSSILFKLFICFWLIIILSIAFTRLLSIQFNNDSVILPAHKGDLRRLDFVDRYIKKRSLDKPQALLKTISKKMERGPYKPPIFWLKNTQTGQVYTLDKNKHERLTNYLDKNTFSEIVSIQFPYTRITGPLDLNINKEPYQLYLINRDKNKQVGLFIMQMPAWARILTPLIISLIISWLLARSLIKPLMVIKKSATQLGDGDLSSRVIDITKRNDELGQLATSFNLMAEKLEQNLGAQQRLLGDISHELRSPMTRLQMALGLAQKSNISSSEMNKYHQRCELEVSRLDSMISDTLALSRLENSMQPLSLNEINLVSLIEQSIEDAQFIANEKSVTIALQSNESYCFLADSQLLSGAVNNILFNAVKYSPVDGQIIVNITTTSEHLVITIEDQGVGVPSQDLPHLFEPFYRVVEARDRLTGGTGLGLAIAKQAVLAHHGEISANNNEKTGLTVTITLPLANH